MPQDIEEQFRSLKSQVEQAKQEAARAQGALEEKMERLKSEFQCRTLKEARFLLEKLQKEEEEALEEFESAKAKYLKKWKTSTSQ